MGTRQYGNQDEREKSRPLSQAEQKRLQKFEALSDQMVGQGFRRVNLTISIVKANMFAIVFLIPVAIVGMVLFFLVNKESANFDGIPFLVFILLFLVLVVVHELIHGASWALFTKGHFKDIEFGLMKKYLTPYCTCTVPLEKGQYIFGALMPLVLVGLVPLAAGVISGSFQVLLLGIIMTDAAAGDIMLVWELLRYKTQAAELVCMDHPTQAGCVVFER
ncbi:Protein of uncharacterised function (DUF3267) [Slackia heliotrinireducens]|uniref:DUF3267 domain-containing protein n=1 Tax=Slackia heliotrinireducens TaxID=84110 RepID=UPI0001A352D3|nr:DUF3267 domain-containing protein [Slackia heliotrinireducens]VEG99100.1 Protein of uncharacterised function (DUF3267) [Slackia heliotrinireducens]